jgi:hypothetical protein
MAGSKTSGPPARIHITVFPFSDERLVRSTVLSESHAMVRRVVRLRDVTELLHTREFRAQKMTFKAPICSAKATHSAAGITARIVISSTLFGEHSRCQTKRVIGEDERVANGRSGV